MNGCSSVWKHIEQLPFLNPVTTCDILMSRSRIYIPLPIALKVNNTYRHHLVQVSPACLRKNRRPARGQMQKFAVKMRSKSSQQRTASARQNFAVNCEWAAGWSDFSPAATALWDHRECAAQNKTTTNREKNVVRHRRFTCYIKLLHVR